MLSNKLVDVYRAPLVDDGWSEKRDWDNKVLVYSGPASVQPYRGDGTTLDAETASQWQNVYIERPIDIQLVDRIYIDGSPWEVSLRPEQWAQNLKFVRCIVTQVTG